ncbi:MAG TPA: type II secretion system F family protein [Mycobacterium sp.]
MSPALLLLGLALLAGSRPSAVRIRSGLRPLGRGAGRVPHRLPGRADPLATASSLDVLALCLVGGMTIPDAAVASAWSAPRQLAQVLRRGADLLALGAGPATAWAPPPDGLPSLQTEALLRLARRSGSSGAALAAGVAGLADQCRHDASQAATAAAERAGVLIAGPLGVCFLPAFVCLGIIPVVAGLAGDVLRSGLL